MYAERQVLCLNRTPVDIDASSSSNINHSSTSTCQTLPRDCWTADLTHRERANLVTKVRLLSSLSMSVWTAAWLVQATGRHGSDVDVSQQPSSTSITPCDGWALTSPRTAQRSVSSSLSPVCHPDGSCFQMIWQWRRVYCRVIVLKPNHKHIFYLVTQIILVSCLCWFYYVFIVRQNKSMYTNIV